METPDDLTAALRESRPAAATFAAFSPSCRREYIEWIVSAKRPETRTRRIATTIQQLKEGRQLHWKYQCTGAIKPSTADAAASLA